MVDGRLGKHACRVISLSSVLHFLPRVLVFFRFSRPSLIPLCSQAHIHDLLSLSRSGWTFGTRSVCLFSLARGLMIGSLGFRFEFRAGVYGVGLWKNGGKEATLLLFASAVDRGFSTLLWGLNRM